MLLTVLRSCDRFDPELFELSQDPHVAPGIILGQFYDQLFDVLSGPGAAGFAFSERRGFGRSLANPATDCPWVNDRGRFVECRTQIFARVRIADRRGSPNQPRFPVDAKVKLGYDERR
jgi:hypothetical protein